MQSNDTNYLKWIAENTRTQWWHDSADPEELKLALENGATGVTTNPVLVARALEANKTLWSEEIKRAIANTNSTDQKVEAMMRVVVSKSAKMLEPVYEISEGHSGYVCAQINPALMGDRDLMIAMVRRFHLWAPNVMVKIPATSAGLDVLERCAAEGIPIAVTVSFTVSQVVAAAERYRVAIQKSKNSGKRAGKCVAVIMIGRLDDYIRNVTLDNRVVISDSVIRQAGLAVIKKAYTIFKEKAYEAQLLVAALRGSYHMTELAGGDHLMSIHPKYQKILIQQEYSREERIHIAISPDVFKQLIILGEFARAYKADGMQPEEFITYGATQTTLSQFYEIGWQKLASFELD